MINKKILLNEQINRIKMLIGLNEDIISIPDSTQMLITSRRYENLTEQTYSSATNNLMVFQNILNKEKRKWNEFNDVIRPKIEMMGKKFFPANEMASKNPKFKNSMEYRVLKDKEDAYAHQLASAVLASMFGSIFAKMVGKANEIKGAFRIFFKGAPGRGIKKFQTFSSGWDEDNANNEIGVEIAMKYPNKDLEFYSTEVIKNINSNNYYDSTGNKKS